MPPLYVPMLKGKEGEFAALESLSQETRGLVMPFIEMPNIPYDFANERPAKTLDEHIASAPDRLFKCYGLDALYLDLSCFGEEEFLADRRCAFEATLSACATQNMRVVPVVSTGSTASYLRAGGVHARETGSGLCLRLSVNDFEDDVDLEAELARVMYGAADTSVTESDLIIDLGHLGGDLGKAKLIVRTILSLVPRAADWRRMIVSAASFPEDLSAIDAATDVLLPRQEWLLWKSLQLRPAGLQRQDLIFGDYAISHPALGGLLDPRIMRMSASIRYTTEDGWLVVKGRNVRQYGFSQYFDLCKALIHRPEFSGADFSWGDRYISDCAKHVVGPGNATTWRKVGVNHHITLVAQALSNLHHGF